LSGSGEPETFFDESKTMRHWLFYTKPGIFYLQKTGYLSSG
jgi:hypothetical protein